MNNSVMPLSSMKEATQTPGIQPAGTPASLRLRQLEVHLVRALASNLAEMAAARQRIDELLAANAALEQTVSEHARREAQALHLAYHDELTGLPNRRLFQDRLGQALAQAARSQQHVALLYLDLDDFKTVNDRLGHTVGDSVLRGVAQRLLGNIRGTDTACRYGGDEFVILLPGLDNAGTSTMLIHKLRAALAAPYTIDNFDIHMAVSLGIAVHAGTVDSAVDLIDRADRELYCTKTARRKVRISLRNEAAPSPAGGMGLPQETNVTIT